ncbi:MAG TPA: ABC transporter permease [Actinomycetales bacterium]|nr:ABC transporter permease [Actinomycetales bacterium]
MSSPFLDAFSFIVDRSDVVLRALVTHLEISAEAVGIALVIGLPLGVFLGHIHRFSFLAINVSNLGRALPSLALLAIFLPIVGIGKTDVLIALTVLAFPPILTNTYVAIDQVEPEVVDASKGIGLSPMQVLLKVELPLALPLIFAGIRTSAVFVVATATLAGFFGGGGLGDIISNQESFRLSGVIGASYVLIVLAFLVQFLFVGLERLVTPAGLRLSRSPARGRAGRPTIDPSAETVEVEEGGPEEDELARVGHKLHTGRDS